MKLKRIAAALVLLCMVFCMLPPVQTNAATVTAEGTCGDNLTWTLTSDGTLTISGTGDMTGVPWNSYDSSILAVVIENGVTSIGDYAFSYCDSLTSVTIPDSVTSIDVYAFSGCSSLTGIWVDENNPNYSSDSCGVLFNKNQTELIRAPGGISGHYTIPDSVTSIGDDAFYYCSSLTSIMIPDGVTGIGNYAFYNCSSLTSVTIPDGVTSIGGWAFSHCSSLTSVTIPDSVTSIGDDAFRYCDSLTSVTIPDSVTSIGDAVFWRCRNLISVTIPDSVTSIGDCAFYGCSSLTSVTIPDSVTSIGNSAFSNCSSLTSVTIPDSVTSIGGAFSGCSSLTGIWVDENNPNYSSDSCGVLFSKDKTELIRAPEGISGHYTIPDGVTSIGDFAFRYCSSLTGIWVDENNPNYSSDRHGVLFNKNQTELIQVPEGISGHYTLPDSVTDIGGYAFYYCSSLTSVTIPDSVTSIGDDAFYYCSSLTSVTIPDSVTSIGGAFYGCSSLTSVTIPDSVTSIGGAFSGCSSLTGIWVDENNPNYSSDSCGVLFSKDKTELIRAPGGISGHYTIPDSVTRIGNHAFSYCDSLTSVTIPDSMTSTGDYVFYDCSSLTSVTIPDSVTRIGDSAFSGCSSLTSVTIPDSVTIIGAHAFHNCSSLTSVTIPDGVTSIDMSTFRDCSSLTSVTIPDSVTYILEQAFDNCTGLTEVIYCGTEEQWNAIRFGAYNTELKNANRQYHDYVNGTCTVCGERDGHVHEWTDGICTGCGQELAAAIELSGDGKITAFDAQLLAEAKAGLRQLTDAQWEALGDLQPSDIADYVLDRFGAE